MHFSLPIVQAVRFRLGSNPQRHQRPGARERAGGCPEKSARCDQPPRSPARSNHQRPVPVAIVFPLIKIRDLPALNSESRSYALFGPFHRTSRVPLMASRISLRLIPESFPVPKTRLMTSTAPASVHILTRGETSRPSFPTNGPNWWTVPRPLPQKCHFRQPRCAGDCS